MARGRDKRRAACAGDGRRARPSRSRAACHGDDGQGGQAHAHAIIGTRGLAKYGTAHRLFVSNRQLMPFSQPGSLDPGEVWQVTARLLAKNGWLDGLDAPLGPDNARAVRIGG